MERDELAFAGVARQAELIQAGEVSSVELVELYLARIERLVLAGHARRRVLRVAFRVRCARSASTTR